MRVRGNTEGPSDCPLDLVSALKSIVSRVHEVPFPLSI